jgi:uncharacterized SAM-binding protein YcdF (DUF218 family)
MAFGIVALVTLVISRPASLKGIGGWLIVSDHLEKADAIVVLGGNLPFRSAEAARLFHEGWATRVWVTAPESASELGAVDALGLSAIPVGQLSVRVLEQFRVPGSAIRVLSPRAEDTVEEIRLITAALAQTGLRRVIIVTSPTHTRRVRAIWRILAPSGQQCFVHHIDRERFEQDSWWKTERDRRRFSHEIGGLAYAWLCLPVIEFSGSISNWLRSVRLVVFSRDGS